MTDDDKALLERLRAGVPCCDPDAGNGEGSFFVEDADETMHEAANRIEALSAENERLNTLINETGGHWLALQNDHPIIWEGAIDAAMKAACDEIRRLRGITKPDPLVEAVKDILDDDSLHNAKEFSEAIRAALAKRGLEIREKE